MCMSADSWTAFYILLLCCYYCSLLADACRSSVVAQRGALITSVDFVLWHRCVIKHRVLCTNDFIAAEYSAYTRCSAVSVC